MREFKDRFGTTIKEGDIVAVAITLNNRRHMHTFTTHIATMTEGQLTLDGAFSSGPMYAMAPDELIVLNGSLSVREVNHTFYKEYGRESRWDKTLITAENAHDFYEKVQSLLDECGEFDTRDKMLQMIKALASDDDTLERAQKVFSALQAADDMRRIAREALTELDKV